MVRLKEKIDGLFSLHCAYNLIWIQILMLVERVTEFAKDLIDYQQYNFDGKCSTDFQSYFLGRDPKSSLTVDDCKMILAVFKQRWLLVKDSSHDYTLLFTESNPAKKLWIDLAKDLAPFVNLNHMCILTDAVNKFDYNDSLPFTTEDAPEHFYLGFNTNILYRRQSLHDHLVRNNYLLCTWDINSDEKILSGLTVEELVRLKSSILPINVEQGANFSDFLKQSVYPNLNNDNVLPLEVMPYFLLLIEKYFILKNTSKGLKLFKEELREFLNLLYKNDKEYLNQFYGVQIHTDDQTLYLVEYLISMHQAQDYILDNQLIILLQGLYKLNPSLRIQYKGLEPIYSSIIPTRDPNTMVLSELTSNQIALNECKVLILSLFTLPFTLPMFSNGWYISIFDQDNRVNLEASEVYKLLEPYLKSYDITGLLNAYKDVMTMEVRNGSTYLFGIFPRPPVTPTWLEHAKNHTLPSLGVRWYNPKLLLHAMLRFPSDSVLFTGLINGFLDELIRTYCQNRNILEQQLRINILFSNLVKNYGDLKECKSLLLLLDVYSEADYLSAFICNCDYYIGNRTHQIDVEDSEHESYSFSSSSKIDSFKEIYHNVNCAGIDSVRTLVDIYMHELESKKGSASYQNLRTYIFSLSDSVLTCDELILASECNEIDSIGAST